MTPPTCGVTVTVASGVTVPRASMVIGTSASIAVAIPTVVCGRPPPRPPGPPGPPRPGPPGPPGPFLAGAEFLESHTAPATPPAMRTSTAPVTQRLRLRLALAGVACDTGCWG